MEPTENNIRRGKEIEKQQQEESYNCQFKNIVITLGWDWPIRCSTCNRVRKLNFVRISANDKGEQFAEFASKCSCGQLMGMRIPIQHFEDHNA